VSRRSAAAAAAILALLLASCQPVGTAPARPIAQPAAPSPPARLPLPRLSYHGEPTQGGWIRGTVPAGTRHLWLDGRSVGFDDDGAFLAAFDRDAPAGARLRAVLDDGREVAETIAIAPRAWEIEHVSAPLRPGRRPSAEFEALRAAELARIAAARAAMTGAAGWRQAFVWPARGRISGRFGAQRVYQGTPASYHSGIDIAGGAGTVFVAPADGVVILAAEQAFTLEGKLLMIDHGNGLNSAFLHCSELLVREGERVRQGQAIGRIGATGRATGPHLHWSLKWHEARLDPILFTGPMPAR
jgi:murein DD-endopeptidase MepM/ murein hydrolase activator NlpD